MAEDKMNSKKHRNPLLISFLSAIGFGLMAFLFHSNKITDFDTAVMDFIQGLANPFLTSVMKFFTFIGAGVPIAVIAVLIMIVLFTAFKHRRELILFAAVNIGSALLNLLLKTVFHRARPDLNRLIEITGFSFPSGHAMAAVTLYGSLAFLLWKHISSRTGRNVLLIFSAFMIMMIGLSRIYLGVHYPSDVIAGFLASGAWLSFSIWVYLRKYGPKID
jgi:undecaprenyl-diphosphatase